MYVVRTFAVSSGKNCVVFLPQKEATWTSSNWYKKVTVVLPASPSVSSIVMEGLALLVLTSFNLRARAKRLEHKWESSAFVRGKHSTHAFVVVSICSHSSSSSSSIRTSSDTVLVCPSSRKIDSRTQPTCMLLHGLLLVNDTMSFTRTLLVSTPSGTVGRVSSLKTAERSNLMSNVSRWLRPQGLCCARDGCGKAGFGSKAGFTSIFGDTSGSR